MQWRGSLAALFIAMGCVSGKEMTVDLNRLILGKSYNSTKVFRTAQHVVQAILLGIVVPLLILLLIWDLTDNPNPVPAVVVIAGLVMLCFFFSYVFVVPDDLTSSATDRTLAIASKIFAYTSRGLTPEAALGASKIILSETIASAICFTDGKQVLASWGEDSAKCPAGTPVVLRTTLNVINSGEQSVFSRDASTETGGYFPRLRAGIVAPLTVRGHCVGTLELYYPRLSSIDMRQTALASGFADLISTQLAHLIRRVSLKPGSLAPPRTINNIPCLAMLVIPLQRIMGPMNSFYSATGPHHARHAQKRPSCGNDSPGVDQVKAPNAVVLGVMRRRSVPGRTCSSRRPTLSALAFHLSCGMVAQSLPVRSPGPTCLIPWGRLWQVVGFLLAACAIIIWPARRGFRSLPPLSTWWSGHHGKSAGWRVGLAPWLQFRKSNAEPGRIRCGTLSSTPDPAYLGSFVKVYQPDFDSVPL